MDGGFDFGLLFWFIILFIFLWPQYRMRALQGARLSLIRKLEKVINGRVITLIHQENLVWS